MPFWLTFFLFVGTFVISELLRPKPKFGAPTPSSLGDFQVPTAAEGRAIQAVFGTCHMKGPNVTWYGDLQVRPIKKKVKTGLFSSEKITTGHRYYLGAQVVLCHGEVDELLEVRWDDIPVPFTHAGDIFNAQEPSQGGWGILGGTVTSEAIDDPVAELGGGAFNQSDGDSTALQGAENGQGAVAGCRFSLGSPSSATHTGWKLYIDARKTGSGTVSDETITLYIDSAWTPGPPGGHVWTGGITVKTLSNHLRDALGLFYQRFEISLTEAEAAQISAGSNLSVLFTSNGFSGTVGTLQRISRVFLKVPGSASNHPQRLLFDAPTQFGGDEAEGGIVGRMDFYRGTLTQTANDYLESATGATLPGYRGISYAVLRRMYVGTSPYLKNISFVVRRTPNALGLTDGRHNIDGDANPIAVIYEILTNNRWGLGIASGQIDVSGFVAAGNTLAAEGLGVSMVVDSQASAADLIAEILRHVDGVLFLDPTSGLIRITLARPNYGPGDPLLLDDDKIGSCSITRPSWDDTRNAVKVRYVDRAADFTERVAQAHDLANIEIRGGEVSEEEFSFLGVSNGDAAQLLAERVLRTVGYPLAIVALEDVNRTAWALRPGDVFRLTWPPLGIADMPCRITRIQPGEVRNGKIRIDAIEDIFGLSFTAHTAPGASGWVNPIAAPTGLAAARLLEVPYALVVGPDRLVMALGAQGSTVLLGFQVWSDVDGTDYALTGDVRQLAPTATLAGGPGAGDVGPTVTQFRINDGPGVSSLVSATDAEFAQGHNLLLINDEIMAWQTITENADGTYTIGGLVRGAIDTTPKAHPPESRVWFISEGVGLVQGSPYDADGTVNAKLPAYNSLGVEDLDDAVTASVVMNSRAQRPYVPRNVTINGSAYPSLISGALTVAWAHRNRLATWSYADGGLTAAAESGCTYTLRFYGRDGLLKKTYSGLAGTSQEWTTEAADSGGSLNEYVRIELECVNAASQVSFQIFTHEVWREIAPPVQLIGAGMRRLAPRRRVVRRALNTDGE